MMPHTRDTISHTQNSKIIPEIMVTKVEKYFQFTFLVVSNTIKYNYN